jgi:hypothetical protein
MSVQIVNRVEDEAFAAFNFVDADLDGGAEPREFGLVVGRHDAPSG